VAIVFGALWAAVDRLARSAWLARWRTADEPPPGTAPTPV